MDTLAYNKAIEAVELMRKGYNELSELLADISNRETHNHLMDIMNNSKAQPFYEEVFSLSFDELLMNDWADAMVDELEKEMVEGTYLGAISEDLWETNSHVEVIKEILAENNFKYANFKRTLDEDENNMIEIYGCDLSEMQSFFQLRNVMER